MRIVSNNTKSEQSFKQIYYTKHNPYIFLRDNAKKYMSVSDISWGINNICKDKNPNPKLIDTVENSPFFKELEERFIYSLS